LKIPKGSSGYKALAIEDFFLIIPLSAMRLTFAIRPSGEKLTMTKIGGVASVISILLFPLSGLAHGFGWSRTNSMTFYCPVVVCVDPCPTHVPMAPHAIPGPVPRQAPLSAPSAAPLAAPSAAPPSTGPIPPGKNQPEVTESRSYYEAFKVRPISLDQPTGNHCALGFWNLTGRDVTVSVDGKPQVIPQGKSLRVQVARQFVWQMSGHEALTEKVPAENSGLEIVLRK
jgi:hypothetical protein